MNRDAVLLLLLCALALALAQLIPLPPSIWQMLPGRQVFEDAATISGQAQPWRPWSIVTATTINAASSLIVPFAAWVLVSRISDVERRWLPGLILCAVGISAVIGLIEFSGGSVDNIFINESLGEVSGTFANRNHFALFLAIGCLCAPIWSLMGEERARLQWRLLAAWGLVLLFLLMTLASGSRAGLAIGVVALLISLYTSRRPLEHVLSRYPRWVSLLLRFSILGLFLGFVALSFLADRAVSIDRVFAVDSGQDMRGRGLPVVLGMVREYLPFGAGLGSFDPIFRLHEPFNLLKPTYFNHAHNDFLEIVLDTGLAGFVLLVVAVGWWAWRSVSAWRIDSGSHATLAKLGSGILFLVMLASIVDYPARTPMIMVVIVIAGSLLTDGNRDRRLPAHRRQP